MSAEAVLFAVLFTILVPVFLGLLAWVLKELVNLSKVIERIQATLNATSIDHERRLAILEHRLFEPVEHNLPFPSMRRHGTEA